MKIRNEIKSYLAKEGVTMGSLVHDLSQQYGWSDSLSNFSTKLSRGTLRYREAQEIAELLGYELKWEKKR